jgi:pSer/pThr/pTyr-binding forkhead associated (FHA) protein
VNATFLVRVPIQGAEESFPRAEHEVLRVGRTRDGNDVSLPGDVRLAGHHCEFFFRDQAWHVRDLETETGILVNGEPVSEATLVGGAQVRAGLFEIVYKPDAPVEVAEVDDAEDDFDDIPGLRPPALPTNLANDDEILRIQTERTSTDDGDIPRVVARGSGRRGRVREIE